MTSPGKRVFINPVPSVVLTVVLVAAGLAAAAPIIANGSFETATIGTWGNGFVGGPAQGAALISEWGNSATSVANWTLSTSLHGGNLVGTGDTLLGMYLRQDGGVGDYSAYVVPTSFGTRQWNLLYGSTVSQSFAVTAGTHYEVAYYQCNTAQAAGGVKLTAWISGIAATGTLTQDANTSFADGLKLHTFIFTPTASGTATLSFSPGTTPTQKSAHGAQLDNVSVTIVSKPGPPTQMPVVPGPENAAASQKPVAVPSPAAHWESLKSFVPAYNRVWTASPVVDVTDTVYAPVMGNGNMSVCLYGDNDTQVYSMRTADFWTDNGESDGRYRDVNVGPVVPGYGLVREIPSGCLRIGVAKQDAPPSPAGQAVGYRQEEDILDAETRSSLPFAGYGLQVRSWVAATEDTMVVELSCARRVKIQVELNADVLDKVAAYPVAAGIDGNMLYLTRETNNRKGARWIARNAYAARIIGAGNITCETPDGSHARAAFELLPGSTVQVVTCLEGGRNATGHLEAARARTARFTPQGLAALRSNHRDWWKTQWWSKGHVRTYDDAMDAYYFRCLYWLGTMCREGRINSGLHGPWKTSDTKHNYSSYCMNDLGAASYYFPLITSDRAETAKMWIQTVYDWIPEGRRRAIEHAGLKRGVFFPVHWGPWSSTYSDEYWGQKYCASFASLVGNWYYRSTEDVGYLRKRVYPIMRECADFYEDWLTKEADGKYHVRGASLESPTDNYQNSCLDLAFAGILFTDIVKYSEVLGVDSERREKWRDIRDHLNEYTTTNWNGVTVYKADDQTPFNFSTNVIETQIVYPGYACNRRSAPTVKEIGLNTINQGGQVAGPVGLGHGNMRGQGSFVAALRIGGFQVEELIRVFKIMLETPNPPGIAPSSRYPCYIADAGLWEFNNQLCMQCYDDGVMFFPDCPAGRRLLFKGLRARGAFLCSGEFKDGAADVSVYSEKGHPFTVIASGRINVSDARGGAVAVRSAGDRCTFDTVAGKMYRIAVPRQ